MNNPETQDFLSKYKSQIDQKKTILFDESGKLAGFVSYAKSDGNNQGFDCPIEEPEESLKDKLKRISKPRVLPTKI